MKLQSCLPVAALFTLAATQDAPVRLRMPIKPRQYAPPPPPSYNPPPAPASSTFGNGITWSQFTGTGTGTGTPHSTGVSLSTGFSSSETVLTSSALESSSTAKSSSFVVVTSLITLTVPEASVSATSSAVVSSAESSIADTTSNTFTDATQTSWDVETSSSTLISLSTGVLTTGTGYSPPFSASSSVLYPNSTSETGCEPVPVSSVTVHFNTSVIVTTIVLTSTATPPYPANSSTVTLTDFVPSGTSVGTVTSSASWLSSGRVYSFLFFFFFVVLAGFVDNLLVHLFIHGDSQSDFQQRDAKYNQRSRELYQ
ncbi:hypothetical protein NX059_003295 [Plenodomus lindquistii]|nr:hypothetical protein NX059_003295 [Plenodomus lindquistii]